MRAASHASLFALVIIVTSLLGFAREIVIARTFGASLEMDCFIVAFAIVSFIGAIISPQTMQTMFMPHYQDELKLNPYGAAHFFNNIGYVMLLIMGLVTLCGYILAPYIVKTLMPGFTSEQIHLSKHLIRIMMPLVPIYGMASLGHALCNAHKRFVLPLSSQTLNNVVLLLLLFLVPIDSVYTLAWYHLIGGTMTGAVLLYAYFKLVPDRTLDLGNKAYIQAFNATWPLLIIAFIDQAAMLLPRSFGSLLEHGDITALNYGFRLILLPVAIIAMAIASVLFPTIIEHVRNNPEQGSSAIGMGTALLLFCLTPISVLMCIESNIIIQLFFGGSNFDAVAVAKTASSLHYYALGIVGLGYLLFLNRIYCAYRRYWPYVRANLLGFAILVIASTLLLKPMGRDGIALAFTIYSYVVCTLLVFGMRDFSAVSIIKTGTILRILLSLAVASLPLYLISASNIGEVAAECALFAITYGAILWLSRDPMLRSIIDYLQASRSIAAKN